MEEQREQREREQRWSMVRERENRQSMVMWLCGQ
jgi:hypothetical protein